MSLSANDPMSPGMSPSRLSPRTGVRRANKVPLSIILDLAFIVIVVVALVASDRAARQDAMLKAKPVTAPGAQQGGSSALAEQIAGGHRIGMIPAAPPQPRPPQEPGDFSNGMVAGGVKADILIARPDLDQPPTPTLRPASLQLPSGQSPFGGTTREEEEARRRAKLQEVQQALKAPSAVTFTLARQDRPLPMMEARPSELSPTDDPRSRATAMQQLAAAARSDDPTRAYQAQVAQLQQSGMLNAGMGGGESTALGATSTASGLTAANGFNGTSGKGTVTNVMSAAPVDRWKHTGEQLPPRAECVIQAGDVLPSLAITEINSTLPGQILAQVSQNVYDTPTKTQLLIPQGTKIVGAYANDVGYGQKALLVAWQRLEFPDGKTLDIGSMPGATGRGTSGLKDLVDNHYVRLFGQALLMSAITAGVTISQQQTQGLGTAGQVGIPQYNAGSAMSQALGQQLGQVTAQLIAKNMNIAPELIIRPGYRLNVVVVKDLVFPKPYEAFDYRAE